MHISQKTMMKYMQTGSRWLLWLLITGCIAYSLLAGAMMMSYRMLSPQTTSQTDAMIDVIVIPGNTVHPDGTPSLRLRSRLDAARAQYSAGTIVIVSGGLGREGHHEEQVMATYLEQQGVLHDDIIRDDDGYTSRQTVNNTQQWITDDQNILVATQWFHCPRMVLAFHQSGYESVSCAINDYRERRDVYSVAREALALLFYLVRLK